MSLLKLLATLWRILLSIFTTPLKTPLIRDHPSKLEILPPELRLLLLFHLPNLATLSALIHASPTYHSSYLTSRSRILTSYTLKHISTIRTAWQVTCASWPEQFVPHGVTFLYKLRPRGLLRLPSLVNQYYEVNPDLKAGILSILAQHRANRKVAIVLSVEQCIAFRNVTHCSLWCREWRSEDPRAWKGRVWFSQDWELLEGMRRWIS